MNHDDTTITTKKRLRRFGRSFVVVQFRQACESRLLTLVVGPCDNHKPYRGCFQVA